MVPSVIPIPHQSSAPSLFPHQPHSPLFTAEGTNSKQVGVLSKLVAAQLGKPGHRCIQSVGTCSWQIKLVLNYGNAVPGQVQLMGVAVLDGVPVGGGNDLDPRLQAVMVNGKKSMGYRLGELCNVVKLNKMRA
ncbi:hypothetical protein NDU88_002225 [Pleurodeles waltl]|uniref:Uncharacterized protein n=1 Tax=Pleurodeles waltl TaxID=8319 RepID=A0AAV7S9Q0_PLEWA|nr:hypothetical protein NDU88_002225 [Pleurodeles waltl]